MKVINLLLAFLFTGIAQLCLTLDVRAAAVMSPVEGRVATSVAISGLTSGLSYSIKWINVDLLSGTVPTTGMVIFNVPFSPGGNTSIIVENPTGVQVYNGNFKVIPSFTIDQVAGITGATITASGSGFAAAETSIKITFDGASVKEGISADDKGTWSSTFTVPGTVKGNHLVDASGATTLATDIQDKSFKVNPSFSVTPASGSVGTGVVVSGKAFDANEANINILFDGQILRTKISADAQGSWSTTFAIPSATKGGHSVEAYGATTLAADVPKATFTIMPGLQVTPVSGNVGAEVKVEAGGFASSEGGIKVIMDGGAVAQNITADSNGNWSTVFVMPAGVNGDHVINAYGLITQPSDVTDRKFTIQPKLVLSHKGGNAGDSIGVTGTGFTGSKSVTMKYGTLQVAVGLTTDKQGSFSTNFQAPKGINGNIQVTAVDGSQVTASDTYLMETTPPDVPRIVSPKDGATVGIIGDTVVTFKWMEVTDPSGVSYDLEISEKPNFSTSLMKVSNLTEAQYALTESEELAHGDYYWRVRAIDGAGNTSAWTATKRLTASYMALSTLVIIIGSIIGLIVFFSILSWLIRRLSKARRNSFEI